jgi:hypothetical protein
MDTGFVDQEIEESRCDRRSPRRAPRVAAALVAVALTAHGAAADMSVGRNGAAADGSGSIQSGAVTTLATLTITKVRRNTIVLVDASVTKIDPNKLVEIYLSIDGTLSGPIGYCQSATDSYVQYGITAHVVKK